LVHEQHSDGEAMASNSIVNAAPSVELTQDIERITSLTRLGDDWDTYGGAPVTSSAAASATNVLRSFAEAYEGSSYIVVRPHSIAPLASGGVNVEWRGPFGELTLEVYPDGRLGCYTVESRDGQTTERDEEEPALQTVMTSLRHILGVQQRA
jgi:hypothetical protein